MTNTNTEYAVFHRNKTAGKLWSDFLQEVKKKESSATSDTHHGGCVDGEGEFTSEPAHKLTVGDFSFV